MTRVFCFSGSGHSHAVAEFFAKELGSELLEIDKTKITDADCAVVVFPVYCQNIPDIVKRFLAKLSAKHAVLIATYGKISHGNVLYEAQKLLGCDVIAAAYVPTGHTYLHGDAEFQKEALQPIFERIKNPRSIVIPKCGKNIFANVFPSLRSRMGVRLIRNDKCTRCNICGDNCPEHATENGKSTHRCIRCMRCVSVCPEKALSFKLGFVMNKYLVSFKRDELRLYL